MSVRWLIGLGAYVSFMALIVSVPHAQETTDDSRPTGSQLDAMREAAYAALQEGRIEEAGKRFQAVLTHRPEDDQALFGLGTLYIERGQYEKALTILEGLYERKPDEFVVLNNLGWLYATASDISLRDGTRAVKMAQEALMISPEAHQVWNTLAEGHFISGNYERAFRAARESLRLARQQGAPVKLLLSREEQVERMRRALEVEQALE